MAGDSLVHVDAAHAAGYTGQGTTIAILDTGIDDRNPDLDRRVVAEHCFVPPDGCPNGTGEQDGAGSAQDDQGHGTEIASVVADTAPAASLVIVKVADANGRSSAAQIEAGLDWVRANQPDAKVVNVSLAGDIPLSGDCSRLTASLQAYAASVDALRAAGASVFAAAGNGGRTNGLPARFPPTVAVGAVYTRSVGSFTAPDICVDRETSADRLACFSNTSSELDLLAAGLPIDATGLGGTKLSIAGTSAASAQAAGVAALLLQADPGPTPDALLGLLRETGTPVADPRNHVLQPSVPRIDAAAALARLTQQPIPLLPAPRLVPRLAVSLHRITFGRIRVHGSARRVLTIHNAGDGTLAVRVSSTSRALSVGPARLRLSGKPGAVSLVFRPTRIGRYSGRVRLATDDPSQPVVTIPFSGVATG